jgi:predicted esterase
MLSVSNLFLKQQDSFNTSVLIFYIFKWFYVFDDKEMSYEECVARITKFLQAVEEEEETLGGENSESEDELEIFD